METQSKNILLIGDIDRIKKGHDASRNTASYSGILHLEKEDIDLKGFLISVENNRDFNSSVIDHITVDFLIENGTYYKKILPEKDTLFITLTKHEGKRTRNDTYKLVIVNNTQGDTGSYSQHASEDTLNKNGMKRVLAQAVDIVWYSTRLVNNSFTLRSTTMTQALIASFNDFILNTRNIKVNGKPLEIDKFNFDEPVNQNFFNNITMDSNITMYDIPTYLQKQYGVYNGNIGTYITKEYITGDETNVKDSVYIYPLYSPSIVKNRKRKMRLYAEKGVLNKLIDATFVNSENSLDILCSAENASKQIFTQYSSDSGAGFSMADANHITKENSKTNDRDNTFMQQGYEKKDGVSPTRHMGMSSNPFQERSNILLKSGTTLTINWNFSIPELVSPGMAVEYIYEADKNGKPSIEIIDGIVQTIYSNTDNNKKNCMSVITVFLNNKDLS